MNNSGRTIFKRAFYTSLAVVSVLAITYVFVHLINLWLLVFLSLILALFLNFFVEFFHTKFRIPRGLGLAITCVILAAIVSLFILTLVPILVEQGKMAISQIPAMAEKLQNSINFQLAKIGSNVFLDIEDIITPIFSSTGELVSKGFLPILSAGITWILNIIVMIVIGLYFAMRPLENLKKLLGWLPESPRARAVFIMERIFNKLRAWLIGQLFSMSIIAVFYSIGLAIIGVPYALFFGILAGILCFVPYIGPPASTVGPLLFALADSPVKAVWVIILYIGSQTLESYFLTPMVMRRQVKLHPVATIVSIMAMGELFGIIGVAVAIPFVASAQFIIEELYLKEISTTRDAANNGK